ncbi:MAG TPA: alpha-glucan family phosphorylase, partial [bacterium]|nr:alpha-glucan family phosphorylase [bacterium]
AKSLVWTTSVFTTHTPVPAGNETFSRSLIEKYFTSYIGEIGITWEKFMSLSSIDPKNDKENFSMTILALKLSAYANGVSRLHGEVSRKMWRDLYAGVPSHEIPIGAVVNGVHSRTWLSPHLYNLFLRYGGPSLINELADFSIWQTVRRIPDEELWAVREQDRRRMVEYMRKKFKLQLKSKGLHATDYGKIEDLLDPKALTIGFARRFATYKRGHLIFKDLERLKKIFSNEKYKVQMIIAGKAHPADQAGKDIIKQIYEIANKSDFRGKIVFIENYDLDIASYLVQGVDIWLNNPIRPMEACGTSGMKAAINGGLNLSVLDGWWDEAYTQDVGWAIGEREEYDDQKNQDRIESDLIYGILEKDIIPLFYKRDALGVPKEWVGMMKNAIAELGTGFNSHRMLRDYVENYYVPAEKSYVRLSQNDCAEAKELAQWRTDIISHWSDIEIAKVESITDDFIYKGSQLDVKASVKLGAIKAENILVECYYGSLDNQDKFEETKTIRMQMVGQENGFSVFQAAIPCERGGRFGYTVRVLPGHPQLTINTLPGFIKWHE